MLIHDEVLKHDGIGMLLNKIPEPYRQQEREILDSYDSAKPVETAVKMHIKLKDTRPIAGHPRWLSLVEEVEVKKQMDGLGTE